MSESTSPLSPTALRSRALVLLSRREHTRSELQTKLRELDGDADTIEAILNEFADKGWQSDQRFAEMFVRQEIRKGHGPLNIRQSMKQRGIEASLIAGAIGTEDWFAHARAIRERRFGEELPDDRKEQARQLRFLQYRGFGGDHCRYAMRPTDD